LKFQTNFSKRDWTVDQFMNPLHKVYHFNSDIDCYECIQYSEQAPHVSNRLFPNFGCLRFHEAVAQSMIWSIFYNIVMFQSCICSLQKSPPTWNMLDVN